MFIGFWCFFLSLFSALVPKKLLNFTEIFFIVDNLILNLQTSWLRFIRFINKYYLFYTLPYFNQICLVFFKIFFAIMLFALSC